MHCSDVITSQRPEYNYYSKYYESIVTRAWLFGLGVTVESTLIRYVVKTRVNTKVSNYLFNEKMKTKAIKQDIGKVQIKWVYGGVPIQFKLCRKQDPLTKRRPVII